MRSSFNYCHIAYSFYNTFLALASTAPTVDATTPTTSPTDTHTTTKIVATERGNVNITYFIHLHLFVNM